MDTQAHLPAHTRAHILFWRMRAMALWPTHTFEDRWNVAVMAKGLLAHHRGNKTKALRFLGHTIKVHKQANDADELIFLLKVRNCIKHDTEVLQ